MKVKLGNISLDSPILPASGVFGYGSELQNIVNYDNLGAIVTKTLTIKERQGNPPPRIWELEDGLLNSIGMQNIGIKKFCEGELPLLKQFKKPVIVSIGGETPDEILLCLEYISQREVDAIEINMSCPNLGQDKLISENPEATYNLIKQARKITGHFLIAKLSPNVTDVCEIGKAAEEAGAEALCAFNTFKGLSFDWKNEKAILGGVSGNAIFPLSSRLVYQLYQKVSIPIIGLGGIHSGQTGLQMILCGATVIGIGTALAINPELSAEILAEINRYMFEKNIQNWEELVGSANKK